jgi:hypothetical protein
LQSFSSSGTAAAARRVAGINCRSTGGAAQQRASEAAGLGSREGAGMLVRNSSNGQGMQSRRSTLSGASSASSSSAQSCKDKLPAVASSVLSGNGDRGSEGGKLCSGGSSRQMPAALPPVRGALG